METQPEREARLLLEGREKILESVMNAEKKGKVNSLPYTNYLVRQALTGLAETITRDNTAGARAGAFKKFALYLGSLDPMIVALRAIQGVLGGLLREGAADQPSPIGRKLAREIGRAVYFEYLMTHFKATSPALFNSLHREYSRGMTSDERHLITVFKAKYQKEGYAYPLWGLGDQEHIGMYLLQQLQALRFIEIWNKTERKSGRANVVKYVVLSEELRDASLTLMEMVSENPAVAAALIEPPLDWSHETNTGGGFHTVDMQRQLPYAVQKSGTRPVSRMVVGSLNFLQSTPWTINRWVLDETRQASMKHDFGDVTSPYAGEKPEYPGEDAPEDVMKTWKTAIREWHTEKRVRAVHHSKAQKAFREAQSLREYHRVWFAWFADSRGRKYVRAGAVSPQGNDLEKGLLMFADGVPMGTDPLTHKAFRIHGASLFGLDKKTIPERLAWVEANEEAIWHVGQTPQDARMWMEADQPVLFLAWAREYSLWMDSKFSPDFKTFIPMGQDGTCNGLQNYSALLADEVGGEATNLVPMDAPQDIYARVATVTEFKLTKLSEELAMAWKAHGINRKVTKRTTMTIPYGATRYAASTFILEDYLEKVKPPEFAKADYGKAANMLSYHVWDSIGEVVIKAREGMDWIQAWAKDAMKKGHSVAWIAPNGLRVVSDYTGFKKREIKSVAFKTRMRISEPTGKPDSKRTANAVAPNFIHSLDAAHLDLVLHEAAKQGIPVAAIHDDFGALAPHIVALHDIIRMTFVMMYKDNTILKQLQASTGFEVDPPTPGTLDLSAVLCSTYFFGADPREGTHCYGRMSTHDTASSTG